MPDKIILHQTIQDLYAHLGIPIEQEAEFSIHRIQEIHGTEPIKSPIFRANYYSFLFIESGSGNYTFDQRKFETKPHTIYFSNPGHLKSFETYEYYTGHIISLSEAFLKEQIHQDVFEDFPFLLAEVVPPIYLAPDEYQPYKDLLFQMMKEAGTTSSYKYKILANLFVVALLKIKERGWKSYNPLEEADRGSTIVNDFKQNLEKTYRSLETFEELPRVQDYAAWQQLHPSYFNTVIKSKTGKSANNWITEKTLSEAKALLIHSQYSIKEIAYQLKFHEPTHFSKFFKRHTQLTPNTYRQKGTS